MPPHEGQEDSSAAMADQPSEFSNGVKTNRGSRDGESVESEVVSVDDGRLVWLRETACTMLGVPEKEFESMLNTDSRAISTISDWLTGGTDAITLAEGRTS